MWRGINGSIAGTLDSNYYKGCGLRQGIEREVVWNRKMEYVMESPQANAAITTGGVCTTLNTIHEQPVYISDRKGHNGMTEDGTATTLTAQEKERPMIGTKSIVRRLTPCECEALQGYPQNWTNIREWTDTKGKKHKAADTPRYKALGNSIAVGYANEQSGFWMNLMKRISAQYERRATLGSLFDGIGGFPLAWETYNGAGSARWASEIEEFPIAVTKLRFPEPGEEEQ